jgi:hypothetical protein
VAGVIDGGVACGTNGVEGTGWGIADVVGTAREAIKVSKASDGGAAQGQPLFHGRSDRLGSWSDRQPLFCWRSDRLGSWSDCQPLFQVRSNHPYVRSDRQQWPVVERPVERGVLAVVRALESHQENHPAKRCLNC